MSQNEYVNKALKVWQQGTNMQREMPDWIWKDLEKQLEASFDEQAESLINTFQNIVESTIPLETIDSKKHEEIRVAILEELETLRKEIPPINS